MHMNDPQNEQTGAGGGFGGMFRFDCPVLCAIDGFLFFVVGSSVEW